MARIQAIRARWNHRFRARLLDGFDQGIGVVTLVSDHDLRLFDGLDQGRCLRDVGLFSPGERERQRIAVMIQDHFGRNRNGVAIPETGARDISRKKTAAGSNK